MDRKCTALRRTARAGRSPGATRPVALRDTQWATIRRAVVTGRCRARGIVARRPRYRELAGGLRDALIRFLRQMTAVSAL